MLKAILISLCFAIAFVAALYGIEVYSDNPRWHAGEPFRYSILFACGFVVRLAAYGIEKILKRVGI